MPHRLSLIEALAAAHPSAGVTLLDVSGHEGLVAPETITTFHPRSLREVHAAIPSMESAVRAGRMMALDLARISIDDIVVAALQDVQLRLSFTGTQMIVLCHYDNGSLMHGVPASHRVLLRDEVFGEIATPDVAATLPHRMRRMRA